MVTKNLDFKFIPTEDQARALRDTSRELMVGGGMAGGKTYFLCVYLMLYAMRYPNARCVLARRKFTQLVTSTLETFKAVVPKELYSYNTQSHVIQFVNGSKVYCTGLDLGEDLDKFSSAELALVCIDQAEELEAKHYLALITRLRQKTPEGGEYPYKILTSCNPRICYLRDRFILNPVVGERTFIPFRWQNNPYLREGYIEEQKENLKDNPALVASLIDGSWDITEETNTLISYKNLLFVASEGQSHVKAHGTRKGVSCDSARFGDDMTVIYGWEGTKITHAVIKRDQSVPSVASECLALLKSIGGNWVAIDTTAGIGAGAYDFMKQLTSDTSYIHVYPIDSSGSPMNEKYLNVRAEMYFTLARYVSENLITIPNDPVLLADLASQTYEYNIDRLKISSKKEIKKRLGRSPDRGDACAIGIYAMDRFVKDHELTAQAHYHDDRPLDYLEDRGETSFDNTPTYEDTDTE